MSTLRRSLIAWIFGVALFIGLPLVGWGLDDVSGFVAHPARVGYIIVTVLLQIFIALRFPGVGRSGGKGTKLVRRQQFAIVLLQIFSLAMVIAVPAADRHGIAVINAGDAVQDAIRYAGLVIFAVGFLMMNWSEDVLGKQFSIQVTIQEDHRLVTAGPYRYLRHPRYLGIILFNLGIALVFCSWVGLALTAGLTLVLLWRIQDEEALMHREFGAAWETYRRQSWHLIPFVY